MGEWQKIDTIPADKNVLLFVPNAWRVPGRDEQHVGYRTHNNLWNIGGAFHFDVGIPTHWMPTHWMTLPDDPKEIANA